MITYSHTRNAVHVLIEYLSTLNRLRFNINKKESSRLTCLRQHKKTHLLSYADDAECRHIAMLQCPC